MAMMLQIANIADIAVHKFFILDKKNVDFFAMAFGTFTIFAYRVEKGKKSIKQMLFLRQRG